MALLTFKLRLETIRQSSTMTSRVLIYNNNVNIKVGVGNGNKVEVNKVESTREYS